MMRRFCMSGVSRHKGAVAASLQETFARPANAPVAGVRKTYSSMQIGFARTRSMRLGVEIGEPGVELEILDAALDLLDSCSDSTVTVTPGKRA